MGVTGLLPALQVQAENGARYLKKACGSAVGVDLAGWLHESAAARSCPERPNTLSVHLVSTGGAAVRIPQYINTIVPQYLELGQSRQSDDSAAGPPLTASHSRINKKWVPPP